MAHRPDSAEPQPPRQPNPKPRLNHQPNITNHCIELFSGTTKYSKATDCLKKDRDELLTFYDFPAEHWKHIRTTNPIESTFATIRLRHRRTKGNGTRQATLTMLFKLAESAAHHWRTLDGAALLIEVAKETTFQDGQILTQVAA